MDEPPAPPPTSCIEGFNNDHIGYAEQLQNAVALAFNHNLNESGLSDQEDFTSGQGYATYNIGSQRDFSNSERGFTAIYGGDGASSSFSDESDEEFMRFLLDDNDSDGTASTGRTVDDGGVSSISDIHQDFSIVNGVTADRGPTVDQESAADEGAPADQEVAADEGLAAGRRDVADEDHNDNEIEIVDEDETDRQASYDRGEAIARQDAIIRAKSSKDEALSQIVRNWDQSIWSDETTAPAMPEFRRAIPTRLLTDQFKGAHFGRVIAARERSKYAVKRQWAEKMKREFILGGEGELEKMLLAKGIQCIQLIVNTNTLRWFPPEIRQMIYKEIFPDQWSGKTNALIIALRGDLKLYYEAIAVHNECNAFRLSRRNDWLSCKSPVYKSLSISQVQYITTLDIEVPFLLRCQPFAVQQAAQERGFEIIQTLQVMKHLRDVALLVHTSYSIKWPPNFIQMIDMVIEATNLSSFRIAFSNKCAFTDGHRAGMYLHLLSDRFRMRAERVDRDVSDWIYEWRAAPGEVLRLLAVSKLPMWEYNAEIDSARLRDRSPRLGTLLALADNDPDDDNLLHEHDPEGPDPRAYGLEILVPSPLPDLRSKREKCLDCCLDIFGTVNDSCVNAGRFVKEGAGSCAVKVKNFIKPPKKKSEHGRVRYIIPDLPDLGAM